MFSVLRNTKVSIQALKAADNESLTGAGVDMQGFGSVTFIVGALEGENLSLSIKGQQAQASDFSGAADLAGTAVAFSTTTTAKGLTMLEIVDPGERYVRPVITVPDASSAKPVFCLAIQTNPIDYPQSNAGELHISPAEGTA